MSVLLDLETAAKHIVKGRDIIAMLRDLPRHADHQAQLLSAAAPWPEQAGTLFEQVLGAFDKTLSILALGGQEPNGLELKRKGSLDKMGGKPEVHNKRRKQEKTRSTFTNNPHYDGHQWRKYGEKAIQGDKYRRSYYRCTYKNDQGCQATKQVQSAGNGSKSMFFVTYKNKHTCSVSRDDTTTPSVADEISFGEPFDMKSEPRPMYDLEDSNCIISALVKQYQMPQERKEEEEHMVRRLLDIKIPATPDTLDYGSGHSNSFDPFCSYDNLNLDHYSVSSDGIDDFGFLSVDGLWS